MYIPLTYEKQKFSLGEIQATPGAIYMLEQAGMTYNDLLTRHVSGDWGDCDKKQVFANERGVSTCAEVKSIYKLPTGQIIWVITDDSREFTTLLLPNGAP